MGPWAVKTIKNWSKDPKKLQKSRTHYTTETLTLAVRTYT